MKRLINKGRGWLAVMILLPAMAAVLMSGEVQAENALLDEKIISESFNSPEAVVINPEAISLDSFLWSNENGQYSYAYDEAESGKKYMLLVVPGIYKSLNGLEMEELLSGLLYIDQKTAAGNTVSFDRFIPASIENSTVIIAGEGIPASIAGYISKDIFHFGNYVVEGRESGTVEDSLTVRRNMTWQEFKSTLPETGFMEVYSDFVDTLYCPVNFSWRDCEEFRSNIVGKSFSIIADVVLQESFNIKDLAPLTAPFVANVTVEDTVRVPQSLTASKRQTVYRQGEAIADDDILVKVLYSDGTVHDVTA